MDDFSRGLVVAKPSWLRDSLVALLTTIPQIETLDTVDDTSSALKEFEQFPPGIVVLLSEVIGDGVQTLLRQIKAGWPLVPCLVLAEDVDLLSGARAAGAEETLLKGSAIIEFLAAVERLSAWNQTEQEVEDHLRTSELVPGRVRWRRRL